MGHEEQGSTSAGGQIALFAAFGVGFAVALVAFAVGVYWWVTRPKPWNSLALTASVRDLDSYYDSDGNTKAIVVNLILTNGTGSDYRLGSLEKVDIAAQRKDALHHMPAAKLETPVFIPAGQAADVRVIIPIVDLWRIGTTRQAPIPFSDVVPLSPEDAAALDRKSIHRTTADSIPREVTGITVYDHTHRYAINVKRAW